MKICKKCNKRKPISEFRWHFKERNIRHNICNKCQSLYAEEWRRNNQGKLKGYWAKFRKKSKYNLYYKLYQYYLTHPCVDCDESDPLVLTFDHIKGKKKENISDMTGRYTDWNIVLKEINKCQVRCFNCHHRRHAIRGKFILYRIMCKEKKAALK